MPRNRLTLLFFCLASCLGAAARAGEGDTLITDPDLLARLGFSPNARNVFLAKGAVLDQKELRAAPEEFGITSGGWTTVLGNQHNPRSSAVFGADLGSGDIYAISGSPFFDAQIQMPSGALWENVSWWVRDVSGIANATLVAFSVCGPSIPPTATILFASNSSVANGEFILSFPLAVPTVVDNENCAYGIRTGLSVAAGEDIILRKARAQWRRQVSPAPPTATFPNDTPTTHPYFRFIEALADSGITAGCAPGLFCPNSPITRGEMAVFLSVALGLHFAN